jgi:hypothetical protein
VLFRGYQIRKNEMGGGGACGTNEGEEKYIQQFGGGNLRERDRRIILKYIFKKIEHGVKGCGLE